MYARLLRSLFAAAALTLTLSACNGLRLQAGEGAASKSQKSCASCKRMCEVAGDASDKKGGVAACKADCDKQCG